MLNWARALIAAREALPRFLPAELFGDPSLQILLELFTAQQQHRTINVTRCHQRAGVPMSTALRCLARLEQSQVVRSFADATDDRKRLVALTDEGVSAVKAWLRYSMQPVDTLSGRLTKEEADILVNAAIALAAHVSK